MKFSRPRLAAAITPAAIGAAAAIVVAVLGAQAGGGRPAAAHPWLAVQFGPVTALPAAHAPVLVDCLNKDQTEPSSFVLTCADGNSELTGLDWQTWQTSGYATGTWHVNDCVPNCAEGKFYNYPALVVTWRPEAMPQHSGTEYFSRLTTILPGAHCFTAGGKTTCFPVTATTGLWSHLGINPPVHLS